jgi:AcrR family transcriptional regulator
VTPAARRGRPPRLSRAAIVAAAQAVVERDGVEALTMRRVADELGASPMALYRHVRGKDELLVLLLDALAAALPRPRLPRAPRARVLAACRHMRDGLAEHPWIVDVLAAGDLIAPSILWLIEEIVAGFLAGGLSPAAAANAYRVIWQFTVGDLIVRRGVQRVAALGRPPFVLGVLQSADPERFPALAGVAGEWAPARARDTYEAGLRALVDGLLAG